MQPDLLGKKILIVKGSLLSAQELEAALAEEGAKVWIVTKVISAFSVIEREEFDAAVIDKGLDNEVFDLCTELQLLNVPYITCNAPHNLQTPFVQKRDARKAAAALTAILTGSKNRIPDVRTLHG